MSYLPIQAQWAIDQSSLIFLSNEVLATAASDNIQALAIVACEQFGNTLNICDETSRKVETAIVPTPQPATVLFLEAAVGYSPHDSTTQFGKSMAGVRFLGLAAALIASFDLFDGAKTLDAMLRSSASDLTMLPTARQLKDLLASLQPRSYRAGFSESVVRWQMFLQNEAVPCILADEGHLSDPSRFLFKSAPSPEMVVQLVDVFRQAHIGESTNTGATIKAGAAAAWVVAFIEWCLGLPPSICMEDNRQLLRQPKSVITLVIPKTPEHLQRGLEITIHDGPNNIGQLIAPPSTRPFSGMATVKNYGSWLLESFGLRGTSLRALHEALEYLIPQALGTLKWVHFDHPREDAYGAQLYQRMDTSVGGYTLHPLPNTHEILDAYVKLLSLVGTPRLAITNRHMIIADLPLVSQYLTSLRQNCSCSRCRGATQGHADLGKVFCKQDEFFELISFITVDIFALSLFRFPDLLLIKLSRERESHNSLERAIFHVAKSGDTGYQSTDAGSHTMNLLKWARSMVGHEVSAKDEHGNTVITSGYGQVIYPTLLDTLDVEKRGYMGITSYQGFLIHKGEIYETVTANNGDSTQDDPLKLNLSSTTKVSTPWNAFTDLEVFWNVGVQDSRELSISLSVRSRTGRLPVVSMHPMDLFLALDRTLLIERCPHDGAAGITPTNLFCSHTSPLDTHWEACNSTSHVDVIPVSYANDLRCFSLLCTRVPAVLRKDACIACCLDLCRKAAVHVLIL